MASMTIRDLDDGLKKRLRLQAARNDRSMEEEARAILKAALTSETGSAKSLYRSVRARIETVGGVELNIERRESMRAVDI